MSAPSAVNNPSLAGNGHGSIQPSGGAGVDSSGTSDSPRYGRAGGSSQLIWAGRAGVRTIRELKPVNGLAAGLGSGDPSAFRLTGKASWNARNAAGAGGLTGKQIASRPTSLLTGVREPRAVANAPAAGRPRGYRGAPCREGTLGPPIDLRAGSSAPHVTE